MTKNLFVFIRMYISSKLSSVEENVSLCFRPVRTFAIVFMLSSFCVYFTGTSPVFTVCHKVSLFIVYFSVLSRDGILLSWTGPKHRDQSSFTTWHLYCVRKIDYNANILLHYKGAQWLSGRVLDSRPRGRGFKPHRRHWVVVFEKDTFILA